MAKTRAIPSLHRDNFLAKFPAPERCSRRVTQPPFIAGPLAFRPASRQSGQFSNSLTILYPRQMARNANGKSIISLSTWI